MKKYLLSLAVLLAGSLAFTSCSDDDDDFSWKEGATVQLPSYRAFLLMEGTYTHNDSHLFFVDPQKDTINTNDIYSAQNRGRSLGDTGNDMIVEDGNIYVVVNHSSLLLKLNGSGVELARYAFDKKLGEPRYILAEDDNLYVTSYGGYVARFDEQLNLLDTLKVDANPEQILEYNDKLYTVCSGFGSGHTMCVIDVKKFDAVEHIEIPTNSFGIQEANGHFYIMSYTPDNTTYVSSYDVKTKTCTKIANASKMLAVGDKLYLIQSTTPDWIEFTSTFSVYDAKTGATEEWKLNDATGELAQNNIYMLEQNPYDKTFYIGTTNWSDQNSVIYHFTKEGNMLGSFKVATANPNSMVFLR